MDLSAFYSPKPVQENATPLSQGKDTSKPPVAAVSSPAVAISWLGILIALVLLRVLYEVSE